MDQNMETRQETPAEDDSLRASLEAAWDSTAEAEASGAPAGEVTAEDTAGRDYVRDETGKFAKAGEAPETAAPADKTAAPAAAENSAPEGQTKAPVEAPSTAQDGPPVSWAADAKAEWQNLSPALKAAVLKRETEASNGIRQYSETTRRYEQVLSPLVQETSRRGISPEQGLNALLQAQRMLDASPLQGIRTLAQQYGVDLATLADPSAVAPQPIPQTFHDPRVDQLHSWFQSQQEREESESMQVVESFATKPHFESVQGEILALLPTLKQANPSWPKEKLLSEAYDRAVYANPTVRAAIIADQQRVAEQKRLEGLKGEASKARLAASPVRSSASPPGTARTDLSLREELEAAFDAGR